MSNVPTVTEFQDSVEATEFMEKLIAMLNDPRLSNWAEVTDTNFGTESYNALECSIEKFNQFLEQMESAE